MPKAAPVHRPSASRPRKPRPPSSRDPQVARIHQSSAWKRLSARWLRSFPLCADPFGWHKQDGRHEPSREVHHIVPLRVDPSKWADPDNLIAVCHKCHKRLDAGRPMSRPESRSESQNETNRPNLAQKKWVSGDPEGGL